MWRLSLGNAMREKPCHETSFVSNTTQRSNSGVMSCISLSGAR
jgi:hypothetical protein